MGNGEIVSISYPDGFTPGNSKNLWAFNGNLIFDYDPFKFQLSGVYNYSDTYFTNIPMLEVLNDRRLYHKNNLYLLNANLTHFITPKITYDIQFSYFQSETESYDDYFGNDWRKWADSTEVANHTNNRIIYRSKWEDYGNYILNGFPFRRDGRTPDLYDHTKQQVISGGFNINWQLNKYNEINVGSNFQHFKLRQYIVNPQIMRIFDLYPQYNTEDDVLIWDIADYIHCNYGYDYWGNEVNEGSNKPRTPVIVSSYVQDQVKLDNFLINAGLRYDYFYTDDRILKSLQYNPNYAQFDSYSWDKLDAYQRVSPRLNFSHSLVDNTTFFAQFGHFYQMTDFYSIYLFGLPIEMEPLQKISYEVGAEHFFPDIASFRITGFIENDKVSFNYLNIIQTPTSYDFEYSNISDSWSLKGIDFTFHLQRYYRTQLLINYTYIWGDLSKHIGSLLFDYRFSKNESNPIIRELGMDLMFRIKNGEPYMPVYLLFGGQVSPYSAGVDYMNDNRWHEPLNPSSTPWEYYFDFMIDKTFDIMPDLSTTFYLRINNLFNTKNVLNVYPYTGEPDDDGFLSDRSRSQSVINAQPNPEQYVQMYEAINLTNSQGYLNFTGREMYGHPRQILFGVKLNY